MQAILLPNHVIQLYPEKKMDNFYCTLLLLLIWQIEKEREKEKSKRTFSDF